MRPPLDRETMIQQAWLPLRLIVGAGFFIHGYPKVFSTEGHDRFAEMLTGLGVPLPDAAAWVVGGVEVLGGLAILFGALVSVAAALLVVNMVAAMVLVHWDHGFSFINIVGRTEGGEPVFGMPGFEVNLLYIGGLATLFLLDRVRSLPPPAPPERARGRAAEQPVAHAPRE